MVEHCKALSVRYRTKPRESWKVVEKLGTLNGGLNAGISKATCSNSKARGMTFIEKRFGSKQFQYNIARREIQILHQICDNMNIATMVDHFLDESLLRAAVYLEYCNLGSLDNVVFEVASGKHVNERKLWTWFFQISGAIAYCHRGPKPEMTDDEIFQSGWSRVYHRDIKPANILLATENGHIVAKLADFGCAVSEDYLAWGKSESHAKTQREGTPGYDAPEFPFFSAASDVWQVGISMLCLCTGNMRPRSKMDPGGQNWDVIQPAGDKYSSEFNSIIKLCLEKDPLQRYTAYRIVQLLDRGSESVMAKLPTDKLPMEIFDRSDGKAHQTPRFPPGHGNERARAFHQQMPIPRNQGQMPPRVPQKHEVPPEHEPHLFPVLGNDAFFGDTRGFDWSHIPKRRFG